jgi:hypothetical protein
VFGLNTVLKVNPEGLYVEDTINGVGVSDQNSVIVCEAGMFLANADNIYRCDGKDIVAFGDPIRHKTTNHLSAKAWTDMLHTAFQPTLAYNRRNGYLMVFAHSGDNASALPVEVSAWCYHFEKKRWDYWTFSGTLSNALGVITGKDGELYLSGLEYMSKIATSNTRVGFLWVSRIFQGESASQKKKWYDVVLQYTGTIPTLTKSLDGATFSTLSGSIDTYAKTFQVAVIGGATSIVKSLAILFRRMVGNR